MYLEYTYFPVEFVFLKLIQRVNEKNNLFYTEMHSLSHCVDPIFHFHPKLIIMMMIIIIVTEVNFEVMVVFMV